jgi:hypothetical protein
VDRRSGTRSADPHPLARRLHLARLQHCGPDGHLGNRYLGYHQISTLSVHNACGFEIHPMFQFYLDIGQSRRLVPLPKFPQPFIG